MAGTVLSIMEEKIHETFGGESCRLMKETKNSMNGQHEV